MPRSPKQHVTVRLSEKSIKQLAYLQYKMKPKGEADLNKSIAIEKIIQQMHDHYRKGI